MALHRDLPALALALLLVAAAAAPAAANWGPNWGCSTWGKPPQPPPPGPPHPPPGPPQCPDGSQPQCGQQWTHCAKGSQYGSCPLQQLLQSVWSKTYQCNNNLDWSSLNSWNSCNFGGGGCSVYTSGYIYIDVEGSFSFAVNSNQGNAQVNLDGSALIDTTVGTAFASVNLGVGYHWCEVRYGSNGGNNPSCNLQWKGNNCDGNGGNNWCPIPKKKWCHCKPVVPPPPPGPSPIPSPHPQPVPSPNPVPPPPTPPTCWDGSAPQCGTCNTYCYKGYIFSLLSNIFGNFNKCIINQGGNFNWLSGNSLTNTCGYSQWTGLGARWEGYILIEVGDEGYFSFNAGVNTGAASLSIDSAAVLDTSRGLTSNSIYLSSGYHKCNGKYSSSGSSWNAGCNFTWKGKNCDGNGGNEWCSIPVKKWCNCPKPNTW